MVYMPKEHTIMANDRLSKMFELQRSLQVKSYGSDPADLEGQERIQFIKDMTLALEDELHEFIGETGWKPWATSDHVNEREAQGELVDAFHFFMNLSLVVGLTPEKLFAGYLEKSARNAARQEAGYDGVEGKCYACKRALDDLAKHWGLPLSRVSVNMIYMNSDGKQTKKPVPICTECAGGIVIVDD